MAGNDNKKVNSVKFWLKFSNFEPIVNKLWLLRLRQTNWRYKDAIVCRNYFVPSLGDGKMWGAALHKMTSRTIYSSQVFKRWTFLKQPMVINKITTSWDKNTKMRNTFVPNKTTIFSLGCCGQRQFYLDQLYLLDQSFVLYAQFLINENWIEDWLIISQ